MPGWMKYLIGCVALLALVTFGYWRIIGYFGGAFEQHAEPHEFSQDARSLIDFAFSDIDPQGLRDYHVHVIGLDQTGYDAWVNPRMINWWGLHSKVKADVFLSGSGVTDLAAINEQYVDRLVSLIEGMPVSGRYHLLAFDYFHTPDGQRDLEHSEIFVSNDYVYALAQRHEEVFDAVVSVHPYRPDAIERLGYWARKGVRFVKWLPNAQGMRPDDPELSGYYSALKAHDMILLTHVGNELAVSSVSENQALGNPLRFVGALDLGVKVLMAHAASAGTNKDTSGKYRDNFELFVQLMDAPEYRDNLFGDISAITQFNRLPGPLLRLLERSDLHHRLVNGSDYPLPAINVVISLEMLAYYGFISDQEGVLLREIYQVNPLLFDFVTKRVIRHPEQGVRFPAQMFMTNANL